MRKIFSAIASCLVCSSLFAQMDNTKPIPAAPKFNYTSDTKKFCIEFNFGPGIPMEDYGNISQVPNPASDTTHINGLASTGFHFNCSANYLFSQNFGGAAMVGLTFNSFNNTAWQKLRSQVIPGIITSADGNFHIGQYLIGPSASIPSGNIVKIGFKALLGVVSANFPVLTQTNPNNGNTLIVVKKFVSSNNFGYYFGANLNIMISTNIGLDFNVGYLGSDIDYHEIDVTKSQIGYAPYTNYSIYDRFMLLGILQMTGGISINW